MTVEEIRGGNDEIDRFPIGMRVLAVDDDPTCLKLLDGLLRKCQYQVTTTSQAITALKMLRENRNRFDLIISDVYMPDMDGFKLLELVGLEMDLPVIMLSGNSDPKLVMKGITHGACDYLVKPVRLEELRNIWQHVIRRKVESKSNSKSNNSYEKSNQGSEGGQEDGNEDQSGKISRKRKDEDEDEDNGHDSDDPSAQKKPRVVWSIDLHRKFVAAVNQLGIEKAVPKRILDLMNVDGLTRENVASHLQKYRLYLKRISHQANMVVAFGGSKDNSSYMRMGSLDGIGDFRALPTSRGVPNSAVSSYSPAGMLGRLNSATGMTLHGLTAQSNHSQNLTKFQRPGVSPTPPNHHLFPAISPSFDLDHLPQSHKQNTHLSDFKSLDQSSIFPGSSTFSDQPSLRLTSAGSESFNLVSNSSRFLDHSGIQPPKFSSHQIVPDNCLRYGFSAPVTGGFGANVATTATATGGFVGNVVRPSLSNQNQICGPSLSNQNQICGPYGNGFSTFDSSGLADGAKEPVCGVYGRPNGGGETHKSSLRPNDSYPPEQAKEHGGFVAVNNGYDALDDLMNGVMKREQDPTMIMDGEFGFDPYAFGSCI